MSHVFMSQPLSEFTCLHVQTEQHEPTVSFPATVAFMWIFPGPSYTQLKTKHMKLDLNTTDATWQ